VKWGQRWEKQEHVDLIQKTADRLGKKPGALIRELVLEFCREEAEKQ
jgi:hypothetical protein